MQTLWKNVTRSEFSFQKTIADTNYVEWLENQLNNTENGKVFSPTQTQMKCMDTESSYKASSGTSISQYNTKQFNVKILL